MTMTLDQCTAHIGEPVVYDPGHGQREDGTIVATGKTLVFVLYVGDQIAKATRPEDLTLRSMS